MLIGGTQAAKTVKYFSFSILDGRDALYLEFGSLAMFTVCARVLFAPATNSKTHRYQVPAPEFEHGAEPQSSARL